MLKLMPTFRTFAWVKNVYSLRTDSGMNSGYTGIFYTPPTSTHQAIRVQVLSLAQVITMLSTVLSTVKNHILNLLIPDLYMVSTVPTIKKKKENKERNS